MATLATLVVRLTADAGDMERGLQQARGRAGRLLGGIGSALKGVGTVAVGGLGLAAGAAAGLGAAIGKLAIDAAPLQSIEEAFGGLAESAGTGMDEMLTALEAGSAGMISQRDLMLTFNKAAQLVSTDFATQLPDAMQYLSKVAAATGQDMSYMMDSLVVGVGRLSPAILDNLSIQTSLAEATSRASEMFGVEAGELTKAQVQAGMMNVVMEKLAENTAAMPDVTNTAAAGMARWQATLQNTKDQIGTAFVPVLQGLMNAVQPLIDTALPLLISGAESIVPVIMRVVGGIESFIGYLVNGHGVVLAFQAALGRMGFADLANKITNQILPALGALLAQISPYVQAAMEWISQNIQLRDVLMGIGAAILTVVIPAIAGIIGAVAPIAGVFLAVVAAVAAARAAWESNFMGIQTTALAALGAIQPMLAQLVSWLQTNIPAALAAASEYWTGTLLPAIEAVMGFVQGNVIPLLSAMGEVLIAAGEVGAAAMAGIWQNVLLPALQAAGSWIRDTLGPIFTQFVGWLGSVTGGVEGVSSAIQRVINWLRQLAEKIRSIDLPDWLTPGSPTPFEIGLRGIADAMKMVSRVALPALGGGLGGLSAPALAAAPAGVGGGGGLKGLTINIYGANDPQASADAVIRALRDRGLLPQTSYR